MSDEPDYIIKTVLTGDSGTGKTNFITRLTKNQFTPDHKSTIGVEFATKILTIKDKIVKAQLWDTAGEERYRAITSAYYRGAMAILLFYDITNLRSFNNLTTWLAEIRKHSDPNAVIMLIGNKCDSPESERQVSTKRGKHFAKQNNLLFYEISALDSINVEDSINKLFKKTIIKLEKNETKKEEKSQESQKQQTSEQKTTRSILLSSSGLKNIVSENVEYFTFIFGPYKMQMDKIFAQFLSPLVSRILLSDPTVNSLNFEYLSKSDFPKFDEVFNDETFSLLKKISRGESPEVNQIQCQKLMLISILLYNEELFEILFHAYPIDIDIKNIELYMQQVMILNQMKDYYKENEFDISEAFDDIAKKFSQIDPKQLLSLPKSIIYTIISNENLQVESEDSLFDFIVLLFDDENENNQYDLMQFLEKIELKNLSKKKCYEYLQKIDPNEISGSIWQNICRIFNDE